MHGTSRKVTTSSGECQELCEDTPHCAHFSWWPDGGCHLQNRHARKIYSDGVMSGQPFCKAEEKEIVAYQEAGWCGGQGNDHRWNKHCTSDMGQGKCLSTIHVSRDECPSGVAHLHSLTNHVWMNWCFYWHVAQYFCADEHQAHKLLQRRDDREHEEEPVSRHAQEGQDFRRSSRTPKEGDKYDCSIGPWSADEVWSSDRRHWCCKHRSVCDHTGKASEQHGQGNRFQKYQSGHLQKKVQQFRHGEADDSAGQPKAFGAGGVGCLLAVAGASIAFRAHRGRRGLQTVDGEQEQELMVS